MRWVIAKRPRSASARVPPSAAKVAQLSELVSGEPEFVDLTEFQEEQRAIGSVIHVPGSWWVVSATGPLRSQSVAMHIHVLSGGVAWEWCQVEHREQGESQEDLLVARDGVHPVGRGQTFRAPLALPRHTTLHARLLPARDSAGALVSSHPSHATSTQRTSHAGQDSYRPHTIAFDGWG